MRKKTRVTVCVADQYFVGWPSTDATECVAWFSNKLAEIPAKYRKGAKIEIDSCSDSCARIEIYYYRPETDDEMAAREAEERRRQESKKARDLRTLAELKAQYGQSE